MLLLFDDVTTALAQTHNTFLPHKSEKNVDSEFEDCKKEVDRMARKMSKNLIKYVEEELEEEDCKFETIVSFEKTVKKVLEIRVTKEDAFHEVSKVLDQIQLGKFHGLVIKVVNYLSLYCYYS